MDDNEPVLNVTITFNIKYTMLIKKLVHPGGPTITETTIVLVVSCSFRAVVASVLHWVVVDTFVKHCILHIYTLFVHKKYNFWYNNFIFNKEKNKKSFHIILRSLYPHIWTCLRHSCFTGYGMEYNLRDTRVKVVFPFPKSGLLCKEIITLRLLPHVIKGHTFSYRPSSHLKNLIQQTWNNHYYHHLKR